MKGLRQAPTREGIRAIALVDHGQGGRHVGIGQVRIVIEKLLGQEHSLVDDRLRRQRRNIKLLRPMPQSFRARRSAFCVPDESSRSSCSPQIPWLLTKNLADYRFGTPRNVAQRAVVARHVGPAKYIEALRFQRRLVGQNFFTLRADGRVLRQEEYAARRSCPPEGNSKLQGDRPRRRRYSCGICIRMPAPSPVDSSAPDAPRCCKFMRICLP